ncbi:MAG: glutathione S-transferase C-terminal domain-containing protein [bacterium]
MHFAEATAFAPLGVIVWHTVYKGDADTIPNVIEGARERAFDALAFVDRALAARPYLLGDEFSAADIMMGFTLVAAQMLGAMDERLTNLPPYIARLQARPPSSAPPSCETGTESPQINTEQSREYGCGGLAT